MQKSVIIYNPRTGSHINNFRWLGARYDLMVNTMAKFEKPVADEMLKRFGFLVEVKPEEVEQLSKEMNEELLYCEYCDYTTTSENSLKGHKLGKHKVSKEAKDILDSIPEAKGVRSGSVIPGIKQSIEEEEGIPNTAQGDVDGWYGGGLQKDSPASMKVVRPGYPGNFGAA